MGSSQIRTTSTNDTPAEYNLDWMKDIPNEKKISQMTIPGTHDSLSLFGICCARTQVWSFPDQMRAGLRYFDIRLRNIDNTLRAFHAFVDQRVTFDSILLFAFNFLDENPSETIIMEIIAEHETKNCTKSMDELYEEYIKNYKERIFEYNDRDVTMGEIRGKVLMIKVFHGSTRRIPNFQIQNNWTVNFRFFINEKKRRIKEFFNRAVTIKDEKIYLNYLSASSDYAMMTPYTAACKCNLIPMRYTGRMGIVLADYPGEDLIKHLIKQNFLFNNKKQVIKNGDKVYIMHNDTHKYLFLDKKAKDIYCVKNPEVLIIRHSMEDMDRDYFQVNDYITLEGKDGYKVEFKIGNSYSENEEEIIDEESLFVIKMEKNGTMVYLENFFENKDKKKHYLFNFVIKKGGYSFYFSIKKVDSENNNNIINNEEINNETINNKIKYNNDNDINKINVIENNKYEDNEDYKLIQP